MPAAQLTLLGGFRLISGDGQAVDVPAKKNRALLGVLALAPHQETTRERLTGLLWSDRGEEQARSSLRQALASLRKDFARLGQNPLLLTGDRIGLDPKFIRIDVSDFLAASAGTELVELQRAAELYRGPFLDGLDVADSAFEDWLREARADLVLRAIKALESLAASLRGAERVVAAERLVALDPLREGSHLALMQAHVAAGDTALAIRQFETCKLTLKRELGVEPSEQLRSLRRSLDASPAQAPKPVASTRKPVIAVLPFDNISGDPGQQYFSDGMTDDIIDRLSRYRILSVIGRHSSFALRGHDHDARAVGDQLRADYILTGNIRKSEDRVRIAARLTDARSEAALWADRYDRPLRDIFAVQDEIAGVIAARLVGRIELEVATRPAASQATLSSYENVLKGLWHFRKLTRRDVDIAADCFEKAIATYPENAEAWRWLSGCHFTRWLDNFSRHELDDGLRLGRRAVELDPASALCHTAVAMCQLWAEGLDAALETFDKAMALNPGDPEVLCVVAQGQAYAGNLVEARDLLDQAYRLNPMPPLWYGEYRGIIEFIEGRYADALPRFMAFPEEAGFDGMYALACAGQLGDRAQIAACRSRFPIAGAPKVLMAAAKAEPFRKPEPLQRLVAGVEKALAD